jgi:hypothetical protein
MILLFENGEIMKQVIILIVIINSISILYGQNIDYSNFKELTYNEALGDFIDGNSSQNYVNEGFYKSKAHFIKITNSTGRRECLIMTGGYVLSFDIDSHISTNNIEPGDVIIVYYHCFWSSRTFSKTVIKKIDKTNENFIIGNLYFIPENLNLREGAGITYNRIKLLKIGEKVNLIEIGKQDIIDGKKSYWVKVKTNDGITGWCFGGYLDYWNLYL